MANLTLTLEADLLKSARKLAIDRDTSVNQLVREFLTDLVETEEQHAAKVANLIALFPKLTEGQHETIPWTRNELHERS